MLPDGDADGIEEVDYILIQRGAAADYHFKLAAKGVEHVGKQLASLVDAYFAQRVAYLYALLELFGRAALFSRCPDTAVYRFDEERDKHQVRRLLLLHLLEHIAETGGYIYLAAL